MQARFDGHAQGLRSDQREKRVWLHLLGEIFGQLQAVQEVTQQQRGHLPVCHGDLQETPSIGRRYLQVIVH